MSTATQPPAQAKAFSSRFITIFAFLLALFVLFDPTLRAWLGQAVGFVLMPLIGFNHQFPIPTLFLAGVIMTGLTVVLRHFFTDYVGMAESQKITTAFNKELRQARVENNKYKLKKLTDMQPQILKRSMDMSSAQMKLMPLTMLAVIPIFAWLAVFMGGIAGLPQSFIDVPWAQNVNLNGITVLPNWVLLYSLISIPFGQILLRALKYFEFKKRLGEIVAGSA